MKNAINALTEKTDELEEETKSLRETTLAQIKSASKEFRILAVLILLGLVVTVIVAFMVLSQSGENNQILQGVDSLVQYVQQVEARPDNSGELQEVFDAIFEIRDIVCESEDPVRIQQCSDLGG